MGAKFITLKLLFGELFWVENKARKTQKGNLTFPLCCIKNLARGPIIRLKPSPGILRCGKQEVLEEKKKKTDPGLDHQCWKVRHMNMGRSRQGSLLLQKGMQRRQDPPYLYLMQVIYLSPSHWSGQGAHSSQSVVPWKNRDHANQEEAN